MRRTARKKLPAARRQRMIALAGVCFLASLQSPQFCSAQAPPKAAPDSNTKENEKVLRHAVFFKFHDSAAEADVAKVVDAFRALPAAIADIREFQLGESLPGATRNDALTHAFLLTFADERGRAAYLPHPAHKEFGSTLRPQLDKVFVIDYWGRPQPRQPEKPLKHAVFVQFKSDVPDDAVRKVEEGLAALPARIDAIKGFEWGKNNSPEAHDQGFTHCFMFAFDSEAGLQQYIDHPAHTAVASDLRSKAEKIRVIDFWAEQVPTQSTR